MDQHSDQRTTEALQTAPDVLLSEAEELPLFIGGKARARHGDKSAILWAARQCAIIMLCALDDYFGRERTITTRRRRS